MVRRKELNQTSKGAPFMVKRLLKTWRKNKSFFLFISLMLVFRSAVADWNEVPTGSMKPTILEGDRILVNKLAYDVRIPFTHISLFKLSDPIRGDIVIFDSKMSEKRLVKRVIGIPNDIVEMKDNTLTINGQKLDYTEPRFEGLSVDARENLLGTDHLIRVNISGSQLSNFPAMRVPENHYLVLGDNRDSSADSRVIGFVPRHEVVGRTKRVVLSFNYENYYIPRKDRFLRPL